MRNYQIRPMKEALYIDGAKWEKDYDLQFEVVEDAADAMLFSVYHVGEDSTSEWLADFFNPEDAELFVRAKAT